jgi:hypothetical protein
VIVSRQFSVLFSNGKCYFVTKHKIVKIELTITIAYIKKKAEIKKKDFLSCGELKIFNIHYQMFNCSGE